MGIFSRIIGDDNATALRAAQAIVPAVNAQAEALQACSDDELVQRTDSLKQHLANGKTLDDILPEAFALVREASTRTLKERHYDVQIVGGAVLHHGNIAEMRTGEGKTLVATLPVYLNALTGKGVHVVTVNDYLSRRDGVWMGQIYHALGLSVGIINSDASYIYDPSHIRPADEALSDEARDVRGSFAVVHEYLRPCTRREAYAADVTYGTNNEFGFDYLRDNLEQDAASLRQRPHHFAIVDEIDSILIDEARTPLIISAPSADAEQLYDKFALIAQSLEEERDYSVDEKNKQIALTDEGIERAEKALGIDNIYTDQGVKLVHHLETAVRAKALFQRDKEYVVRDGGIVIVDEFTGRLQPGRRWSDGLHQAIEAKEGVAVQRESRTVASITFQNYFRLYEKLSGMTGTATTSSEEFYKVYGLRTVTIPTHRPPQRIDRDDLILQTEAGKYQALVRRVKELHTAGKPVLIGTVSVERNELLSAHFRQAGIPHQVLNAKNHEEEGNIIAQAGRKGAVTIATNMAGRGVDIKLGGNPATKEQYEEVKALGGLAVIGTERHEARRIDNQLRGRSGRQGDPGETQFFVSLEDSLMRIFASDTVKKMMGTFGIPEDEPIASGMISRALERAQKKIEEFNFDARKQILAYDDVLNIQRESTYRRRRTLLTGDESAVEEELLRVVAHTPDMERIVADKRAVLGDSFIPTIRAILLQTTDMLWMDHLEAMEYLRSSVSLRAVGQRDPLVEYKREGLALFQAMETSYLEHAGTLLSRLGAETAQPRRITPQVVFPQGVIHKQGNHARNDKVLITNGTETKEMKFKKAEPLIQSGEWRLAE